MPDLLNIFDVAVLVDVIPFDIFPDLLYPCHSSDSTDSFRYFNTDAKVVNKATPTDVILNARKSSDKRQALEIVEKGLKEFPNNEVGLGLY